MDVHSLTGRGFLSVVPLEIRNLIYHLVFDRYYYSIKSSPNTGHSRVPKALRDEAAHTLYAQSKHSNRIQRQARDGKTNCFLLAHWQLPMGFRKEPRTEMAGVGSNSRDHRASRPCRGTNKHENIIHLSACRARYATWMTSKRTCFANLHLLIVYGTEHLPSYASQYFLRSTSLG